MIAGFLAPSAGAVRVAGRTVTQGTIPERLGYISQKDTVLPWLNVGQNIGLGLRYRGVPEPQIRERVAELLGMAGLAGYESLFPHQLSGGMRQRVALLMTLACDPTVLLLDSRSAHSTRIRRSCCTRNCWKSGGGSVRPL